MADDEYTIVKKAPAAQPPAAQAEQYTVVDPYAPPGPDSDPNTILGAGRQIERMPGLGGSAARGVIGFGQGMVLDPVEAAAQGIGSVGKSLGVDLGKYVPQPTKDYLEAMRRISESSPSGAIGRVAGGFADPLSRAVPEIGPLRRAAQYAAPALRAGERLAQGAYRGAVGGLMVPLEEDSKGFVDWMKGQARQLPFTATAGALTNIPTAAARVLSLPNWRTIGQRIAGELPGGVGNFLQRVRSLGDAGFNTAYYQYILQPLRDARVPMQAGFASVNEIANRVGAALDTATRGMSWSDTPASRGTLISQIFNSTRNLLGDNVTRYTDTIERTFRNTLYDPVMRTWRGNLNSTQFQTVVSNLKSAIDNITDDTADNRALKRELENFRTTLFDSANMSPHLRDLYQNAREAWHRFAILRDGLWRGNENGVVPARNVDAAIQERQPMQYARGTATGQHLTTAAQNAIVSQRNATVRALQGRGQMNPEDYAQRAGQAAAVLRNTEPHITATHPAGVEQ